MNKIQSDRKIDINIYKSTKKTGLQVPIEEDILRNGTGNWNYVTPPHPPIHLDNKMQITAGYRVVHNFLELEN